MTTWHTDMPFGRDGEAPDRILVYKPGARDDATEYVPVARALEVAERAWEYGAPALYEDDVIDLFAALGQPINEEA